MTTWFVRMASGVFAGWLIGLLMQGRGYGLLGDLVLGLLGGLTGGWIIEYFHITLGQGLVQHILIATAGGALLVGLLRLMRAWL